MECCYRNIKRNRFVVGIVVVVIIILGLLSRNTSISWPSFFVEYGGDTLWASMMYTIFCFIIPKVKITYIAIFTAFFSYMIEFSQMLQYPWLVALRKTPLRYLLGQGFVWSDLLCYTIGCVGIAFLDYIWIKRRKKNA